MADRTIVSTSGLIATFGIQVKNGDKGMVPAKFNACKDWASFKEYVKGLSDTPATPDGTSATENVYNLYLRSADLAARAQARDSVAAESTIVRRDGKEIDIMAIPLKNAVGAINAAYAEVAMLGGKPGGAFSAARRKLIEAGTVGEKEGVLVVK